MTEHARKPVLWLVAGANGVGKTTYAKAHIEQVSGSRSFVNLDEIARGLSPLDPEAERVRAARVSLDYLRSVLLATPSPDGNGRKSITLETTLAGRTHLRSIALAKAQGWAVHLLYLAVTSVEVSLARIARRVSEGGHDIPEADARRRFARSLANFGTYAAECEMWRVFDNNARPRVVAEGRGGCRAYLADGTAGLPSQLAAILCRMPVCSEG
ncbi:MAG: zeta toxin family protein [Rhizobiaceae bacterium]|nr:zeta toxin family protein [Rhizobiaceae bacterium]